jgi:hypothetical protein
VRVLITGKFTDWLGVVKEKDREGLGVGIILAKNKALLFKWI